MGRLKTAVTRSRCVVLNKERRRQERAVLPAGYNIWGSVDRHVSRGHKLCFIVDDDGQVLDCMFCGISAVMGSDGVMEAVIEELKTSGIEFEVVCETKEV
jgi:hypothetical protein